MEKHILVVTQYFYPEQFRINDMCEEWVKRGHKVTVLTGIPNYPEGKYYKGYGLLKKRTEKYKGMDIIRIPLVPRGNGKIMLVLNYLSFVISGFFWKISTKLNTDLVFIFEVSPMTQALPGIWFAKKKNVPCYLYVQDLWPENVEIITGIKNKFIIDPITKMVKYIYRNSDKIFTTSKSFVESIIDRGIDRDKVGYWPQYAEDFYKPIKKDFDVEIPNDDKINFVFAGNIGEAQGLEILPKVATKLIGTDLEKKIRFNIIGNGRYKDELINLTKKFNNSQMFNFIERKPAEEIPKYMAASDIAFLSLNDHPLFSKTIPAKLQSYMACGMPIIASASGETENIIAEANAGYSCKPGDVECLKEIIEKISYLDEEKLKQLSINSRKFYEDNFDKEMLLNHMEVIIQG